MNFIDALRTASVKAFEDWGMMLVDEQPAPSLAPFTPEDDLFVSWVDVSGGVCCRLSIVAQPPFLEGLCCNVLGESPDAVEKDDRLDGFRELSNIITGAFLTSAFGHGQTFDLFASNVQRTSLTKLEGVVKPETYILFVADESPVLVGVEVREENVHD